jgi:syntaxin 5
MEDITPVQRGNISVGKMTSRDRTMEFVNIVRFSQGRHVKSTPAVRYPKKPKYIQSYAEFMAIARSIGKNIGSTNIKLEKLTLLAKRKSLFNDRAAEIEELTYIIKEDLNSLNQQIAKLQKVARNRRQSQQNVHNLLSHTSNVVLALESKLASMCIEFKQAVDVRIQNLQQQKSRHDQFFPEHVSSSISPSALWDHRQGSALLNDEVTVNREACGPLLPVIQKQAMIYDDSRAEEVQKIESTIVELGALFQQLARTVKEQGETVERIDSNVQDAELNVEEAHNEITKYFRNITTDRWLMIKTFGVLIFFFLFFGVFLV